MDELENNHQPSAHASKLTTGLIVSIVIISLLCGSFAGLAAGLFVSKQHPANSFGNPANPVSETSDITTVVQKASPAVVSIIISKNLSQQSTNPFSQSPFFFDPFFQFQQPTTPPQQQNAAPQYLETGAGSGFFVTPDGIIMTNKHVVSDTSAKYTVITSDGKQYDAKVLSVDPVDDLALVKIDIKNAPILRLADSSKIQIGQEVIAIGNSLGQYSNTVTTGVVSGIGRTITAGGEGTSETLEGVLQTDAAINPGNSGGPLLNIYGDVIGVNTAIDQQGQLVGFAIPANDAAKALQTYDKYGKIVRPFLGIHYVLITPAVQQTNNLSVDHGAWVYTDPNSGQGPAVVAGSAADKAGIKEGDIIVSINGQQITQNTGLAEIIRNFNPGDTIDLQIIRDKQTKNIKVTLDESK